MAFGAGPAVRRVRSGDGAEIGYWTSGEGSLVVLVHGMAADHSTWDSLVPHLESQVAVHAMDRRGRGASGDGAHYSLAREFEDLAAVVDAIARAAVSPVDVLGHSFGGLCTFGGATLTKNIRRLVLYEGWQQVDPAAHAPSLQFMDHLETLLAAGEREALLTMFVREVAGISEEELSMFQTSPVWQARVAAAHTIPREIRAGREATLDSGQAAKITAPTLLLIGGESTESLTADHNTVAAALKDAQVSVLEGQSHAAHHLIPDVFAERVLVFLRTGR